MNTNRIQEQHAADATRKLAEALHYHRYFGKPIAEFSERHNQERAYANERLVRCLAFEAGRSAYFSGLATADLASNTYGVIPIWEAFVDGYHDTKELLSQPDGAQAKVDPTIEALLR